MAITQNDLQLLKAEVQADTDDGGGLPTSNVVADGVSNNLFPDMSDLDRQIGRVRLRKIFMGVQTANRDLLQAARLIFTELPANPNISVFAFKATSFADRRSDAQNKIESYLAFGSKWAGHLLETQLAGQRVIQVSLDKGDQIPAVGQPLVLVQNEGQSDEYYQYIRPLKVDTVERRFQRTVSEPVTRTVATIEFGDTLQKTFNGLTVQEFYQNANTSRRAILREARVADAAKYYSASRLAEPVVAMASRQVRLDSIYTQVVPSTQVETPILQRDPANQVATQARGDGIIAINQSVNVTTNTAFNLPSGVAVGTLSLSVGAQNLTDRDGELVNSNGLAYASIKYGIGQITWYDLLSLGQTTITGSYKPASEFTRVAQTDYQVVDDNAGYNYVRELGAEPVPNSLKITYTVGGDNYLVHDDGRGNLIDDDGNGRGTVQGKTVLLTTAAIPDAASYIVYSFGVDLDTVKYGEQMLAPAYHAAIIEDEVVGDITITWGENKTATMSDGVITGDATGAYDGREIHIAPNDTVAKDTVFTVAYNKLLDSMTSPINAFYNPNSTDGTFTATIDMGGAIDGDIWLRVELYDGSNAQVAFDISSMGTAGESLKLDGVVYPTYAATAMYRSGNTMTPQTGLSWYPADNGAGGQWKVFLVSSNLDKAAGMATFTIKVSRRKTVTDVVMAGGLNKKPLFTTTSQDENLNISTVQVYGSAEVGSTTEAATFDMTADKLLIAPPMESKTPVINGSVFVDALGYSLRDDNGRIKNGDDVVGDINLDSGVIELTTWQIDQQNTVTLKSMLRENDPVPLANLIFRTPVAPLKKASLQISAELADGTPISLSTDEQGGITGSKYAHGMVDFKAGFVALYFYEKLGVTANPSIVNESWYDAANIYMEDSTNYINKPIYVKPDSIRYNAIAYSYLPLDKELIGLDPVRLPTDGRVPFVRKGDSIAITELKTMALPTNAPNDVFDLGFERLSDVSVIDSLGVKVDSDHIDVDLDAGIIVLNDLFDVSQYAPPLTAKYRIMDMALVIETDISGRVTLSTPITHDYTTDAVLSSMLIAGDMQARAYNVFSQKTWGSAWSDTLIGESAVIQLQTANNPIVVTNKDAITEQWALVFTSVTEFRIIGRTLGQIGTSSVNSRTSPINPQTGQPYFVVEIAAWGGGGAAGNAIRFNTQAAAYPLWIGNAIGQHVGSSKDNYDFTVAYHANIDREREQV